MKVMQGSWVQSHIYYVSTPTLKKGVRKKEGGRFIVEFKWRHYDYTYKVENNDVGWNTNAIL